MALIWDGQKMIQQVQTVQPYVAPVDPYAQTFPKMDLKEVTSALKSFSIPQQSWTQPNAEGFGHGAAESPLPNGAHYDIEF